MYFLINSAGTKKLSAGLIQGMMATCKNNFDKLALFSTLQKWAIALCWSPNL